MCELLRSCSYDPNQNRSTTGFQTFDTDPFILSLKRSTKKIRKALNITLLQFLTLSCWVVTKRHTYLEKNLQMKVVGLVKCGVYDIFVSTGVEMY